MSPPVPSPPPIQLGLSPVFQAICTFTRRTVAMREPSAERGAACCGHSQTFHEIDPLHALLDSPFRGPRRRVRGGVQRAYTASCCRSRVAACGAWVAPRGGGSSGTVCPVECPLRCPGVDKRGRCVPEQSEAPKHDVGTHSDGAYFLEHPSERTCLRCVIHVHCPTGLKPAASGSATSSKLAHVMDDTLRSRP